MTIIKAKKNHSRIQLDTLNLPMIKYFFKVVGKRSNYRNITISAKYITP